MAIEITVASNQTASLPSLFLARPAARTRLRDFFSSHLRTPNTRRAYLEAVRQFSGFCAEHDIVDLAQVESVHVAAFVEAQLQLHSRSTVKLPLYQHGHSPSESDSLATCKTLQIECGHRWDSRRDYAHRPEGSKQ